MALIQTVEPDNAEGKVKEIYDFMQKNAGVIFILYLFYNLYMVLEAH